MRRNQLSVKLERFGSEADNGSRTGFIAYSDGNDLLEVTARAIEQIRKRFFPDTDSREFYRRLSEVDTESSFFGVVESEDLNDYPKK